MDICRFINSKDIAKHLTQIGYEFRPLEIAWLIWQCKTASMPERHTAWKELIQTEPDCSIEKNFNVAGWPSLHKMLERYMMMEKKLHRILEEEDPGAVYFFDMLEPNQTQSNMKLEWHGGYLSKSFTKVLTYVARCEQSIPFRIRKQWVDSNQEISGYYNAAKELLCFDTRSMDSLLSQEELELLYESFDGMWFDFPIPFQKGDLVQDVFQKNRLFCLIPHCGSKDATLRDNLIWTAAI